MKKLTAQQLERLREWGARIEDHSDKTIVVRIEESGDLGEIHNALEILAARTRSVEAVRVRKFEELQARDADRTRQIVNYRNSLRANLTDMKNLKSNFESYLDSLVASFDDRQK